MTFWIACDVETDIVIVDRIDEGHEIGTMFEAVLAFGPFLSVRGIATESEAVTKSTLLGALAPLHNLSARHFGAAEMQYVVDGKVFLIVVLERSRLWSEVKLPAL